jgi:ABC-type transport system involved in cytochrome bd biosynthesis fused ATPase/permease subunit
MQSKKLMSTFFNKSGFLCLGWATIQQLVVATSTFFIIEAIRNATANNFPLAAKYIAAFTVSMFVVYLPNTVSLIYLQKWRFDSFKLFLGYFIDKNFGKSALAHARHKTTYEAQFSVESSIIYDNFTSLFYQLFSIFISTALNVAVISVAIDRRIFVWYLFAGVFLFAASRLFSDKVGFHSIQLQRSRKNLADVMLSGWDNIFIGNQYTLAHWKYRFANALDATNRDAVSCDFWRSLASSITVSLALLLIAAGNGKYYVENNDNVSLIAALFVTFPRQLQIVQNIFSFFSLLLAWDGSRRQAKELQSTTELGLKTSDSEQHVQLHAMDIRLEGEAKRYHQIDALKNDLLGTKTGRMTIRGKNGAGKSTLLSLLADMTGSQSFFLPSKYGDLAFREKGVSNNSDGNMLLAVMQEIIENVDTPIVILDEWDANLDEANMAQLSSLLDLMAETRLVIESRHRM